MSYLFPRSILEHRRNAPRLRPGHLVKFSKKYLRQYDGYRGDNKEEYLKKLSKKVFLVTYVGRFVRSHSKMVIIQTIEVKDLRDGELHSFDRSELWWTGTSLKAHNFNKSEAARRKRRLRL